MSAVALVLLGAACSSGARVSTRSGATTTASTPSASSARREPLETTAVPQALPPTPDLAGLRLPPTGLAVAYADDEDHDVGLELFALDGSSLAALFGWSLVDDAAGPLLLHAPDGVYLLDSTAGRLVKQPSPESGLRSPLAYGAELLNRGRDSDPGSWAIESDGRVVAELGTGAWSRWAPSHDRDLVTLTIGEGDGKGPPTVFDLKTNTRATVPDGCEAADRHGARWLLLCRTDPNLLPDTVKVRTGTRIAPLFGAIDVTSGGHWQAAMYSNDGKDVLLQWSGECETQSVYLGRDNGARATPKPLPSGGVEAHALGWSPANEAVVFVPSKPGCGYDRDIDGVHLIARSGSDRLVLGPQHGLRLRDAALWTTLPH